MSGSDGFFKIKPTKRSNPEERTTLDVIHQHQLMKISEDHNESTFIEEDIQSLQNRINDTSDDLIRGQLENKCIRLKQQLDTKKDDNRLYNYLLDTGEILFDYYDLQEKISQGHTTSTKQWIKRKPGDVLSAQDFDKLKASKK